MRNSSSKTNTSTMVQGPDRYLVILLTEKKIKQNWVNFIEVFNSWKHSVNYLNLLHTHTTTSPLEN